MDVAKTIPAKELKQSCANQVLILMSKIFKQESYFVEKNYTTDKIYESRNSKEYLELVNDLKEYVFDLNPAPNSELSKAINYFKNSCDELFTYLEDGHVECSNNIAERAVKSFVIMRKNFLFSKSELGANASATLFSIVQTARANALHPEAYITYLLENINKKKIDDLLPWSNQLPNDLKVKLKA